MSVVVTLLPFDRDSSDFAYSHTVLTPGQDEDLYEILRQYIKQYGQPVPKTFNTYVSRDDSKGITEVHYGNTTFDAYGEPVKWIHAKFLKRIESETYIDKAVFAYIKELPDDTKIAIYWS